MRAVVGIHLPYSLSQRKQTILALELPVAQKHVHNIFKMVLCYSTKETENSQRKKSMYFGFLYYTDVYGKGVRQLLTEKITIVYLRITKNQL